MIWQRLREALGLIEPPPDPFARAPWVPEPESVFANPVPTPNVMEPIRSHRQPQDYIFLNFPDGMARPVTPIATVPQVHPGTWTDNDPTPGAVSWTGVVIGYGGVLYPIEDGTNETGGILWWDKDDPNVFQVAYDLPPIVPGEDLIIGVNWGGYFQMALVADIINTAILGAGIILSDQILTSRLEVYGEIVVGGGTKDYDFNGVWIDYDEFVAQADGEDTFRIDVATGLITVYGGNSIDGDSIDPGTLLPISTNFDMHLMTGTWTDDSPSAGYVAWSGVVVYYKGSAYSITNGNSNKKYIYWDFSLSTTTFQASDTKPTLTADDIQVCTNDGGQAKRFDRFSQIEVDRLIAGTLDVAISISTGGYIKVGTGTKGVDLNGIQIDPDAIVGQLDGVTQAYWDVDTGAFYFGANAGWLDVNGFTLNEGAEVFNALKWVDADGHQFADIYSIHGSPSSLVLHVTGEWGETTGGEIRLEATNNMGQTEALVLTKEGDGICDIGFAITQVDGDLWMLEGGVGTQEFYTILHCPDLAANVTYTLPTALPASSKFLQATSAGVLSWEAPASGILLAETTTTTISSSATETTLMTATVLGNSMGASGILRIKARGTYYNNSGDNRTITFRVKLGATTVAQFGTNWMAPSASWHNWVLEVDVWNVDATNVQSAEGWLVVSGATTSEDGQQNGLATAQVAFPWWYHDSTAGTLDTTADQTIALTGQIEAPATQTLRFRGGTIEVLKTG